MWGRDGIVRSPFFLLTAARGLPYKPEEEEEL